MNEWYTPSKYIEAAREVMGSIDLDPASCELANRTVQATTFYTIHDDGLTQEWHGNVWLNPPYSEPGKWINKLITEYKQGGIHQAIVMVNACTDTHWYQKLFEYMGCFVRGRIDCHNPIQKPAGPRHPTSFVYLGNNEQKFIEVFRKFGTIAKRVAA